MIPAILKYHKKLFKRNPIVIIVMGVYCLIYLVNRCSTVYLVNHDSFDFVVESLISYFAVFHFMPAFFNRDNHEKTDDQFLQEMRGQNSNSEQTRSISRHHSSSTSSRYDHNRNSQSSSLHNSSLGRGFL